MVSCKNDGKEVVNFTVVNEKYAFTFKKVFSEIYSEVEVYKNGIIITEPE